MSSSNRTPFTPSLHGFHFCNSYVNGVLSGATFNALCQSLHLPVPSLPAGLNLDGSLTTSGRCGGMAWASLDYYFAQVAVPTAISGCSAFSAGIDDFSGFPNDVPADGTALSDYIYKRLFDSFVDMVIQTLGWVAGYDHNTWFFGGVPEMTTSNEFPRVKRAIDGGTPVVLSLINWPNSNVSACHQVVAYGYAEDDFGNMSVQIYDNNHADDDGVVMTAASNGHWTSTPTQGGSEQWKGWFVEGYWQQAPPFFDVGMASSISAPAKITNGDNFNVTFSAKNFGPYPAHVVAFQILGNLSIGSFTLGPVAGPGTMAPGTVSQVSIPFTDIPWIDEYGGIQPGTFQAQYQTLEGWWIPLVSTTGNGNSIAVSVAADVGVWIDVGVPQLGIEVVNGVLQGIAAVTCVATIAGWKPGVTLQWFLDGGATSIAAGPTVTINVPCGGTGALQLTHEISVVASGTTASLGTADTREVTVQLTINPLRVSASVNYGGSELSAQTLSNIGLGGAGHLSVVHSTYSKLEIDTAVTGAFGTMSYEWGPSTVTPLGTSGIATITSSGPNQDPVQVRVAVTDQLKQVASTVVTAEFTTVTSTSGVNYNERPNSGNIRLPGSLGDPYGLGDSSQVVAGQIGDPAMSYQRGQLVGQIADLRQSIGLRGTAVSRSVAVVRSVARKR